MLNDRGKIQFQAIWLHITHVKQAIMQNKNKNKKQAKIWNCLPSCIPNDLESDDKHGLLFVLYLREWNEPERSFSYIPREWERTECKGTRAIIMCRILFRPFSYSTEEEKRLRNSRFTQSKKFSETDDVTNSVYVVGCKLHLERIAWFLEGRPSQKN